jgi:nucleoside-diphosphate-sugar epimerase
VGISEYISLNRVAEEIFKLFEWYPPAGIKHLMNMPVGVLHRALDGSYALEKTGWFPKVSLEEGIKRTVEWYISHKDPQDVASRLGSLLLQR